MRDRRGASPATTCAPRAATSRAGDVVFDAGTVLHARAPRRAREPRRRRGRCATRARGSACSRPATSSSSAGPLAPGPDPRLQPPDAARAASRRPGCERRRPRHRARRRGRDHARRSTTAVDTCDALLTSGAVSVGDYDFVKIVLERLAARRGRAATSLWAQVAIKPAKPLAFGALGARAGVRAARQPGLVARELRAVRPARAAPAAGHAGRWPQPIVRATAPRRVRRAGPTAGSTSTGCVRRASRTARYVCERAGVQASNVLSGMAAANGLALLADGDGVEAGAERRVRPACLPGGPLNWSPARGRQESLWPA